MKKRIFLILLTLVCFLLVTLPTPNFTYAVSNTIYSNVLDDLQNDEDFDVSNYPVDLNDYTLSVIQIAESEAGELFIYVYQPCSPNNDLRAKHINISFQQHFNESVFAVHSLRLLNTNGVFGKYLVRNVSVANTSVRYYNIASIYRAWSSDYDDGLPDNNENIINEVSFEVATCFIAQTNGDSVVYTSLKTEVVYVTDKYVGFVRYRDGYNLWPTSCDAHFVAFNTNVNIDNLLEADLYFTTQTRRITHYYQGNTYYSYGDLVDSNISLSYDNVAEYNSNGIFGRHYSWNRIESVTSFISRNDMENVYSFSGFNVGVDTKLTDEGIEDVEDKQWVLNFIETDYSVAVTTSGTYRTVEDRTLVGNVSILRLKYETNGITYNLGVVDNMQTGDGIPDNYTTTSVSISNDILSPIKSLLSILLLLFLIILLWPFLPTILNIIWFVIKTVLNLIIGIIKLPFKLLGLGKKGVVKVEIIPKKGGGKK